VSTTSFSRKTQFYEKSIHLEELLDVGGAIIFLNGQLQDRLEAGLLTVGLVLQSRSYFLLHQLCYAVIG
jgi:hypothetical protein